MNAIDQELSTPVRLLIDEHLDGLERVLLGAGVSRAQRLAICEDVELQVREMLWQRTHDAPTAEHARAVLAELDPPEAFLDAVDGAKPSTAAANQEVLPRTHALAITSAVIPILGVMTLFSPLGRGGEAAAIVLLACAEAVALLFGVIAIRDVRRAPSRWTGVGLAVFGVLALPLLVANFFAYMLVAPKYYQMAVLKAKVAVERPGQQELRISNMLRELQQLRLNPQTRELETDDDALPEDKRKRIAAVKESIALAERERSSYVVTDFERWRYEHRGFIEVAVHMVTLGLSGAASVLLYLIVRRRSLPKLEGAG